MPYAAITNLVLLIFGILHPAYMSYKAIKSSDSEEGLKLMKYWTVFGFFKFVESLLDFFLYWIPLYYPFKLIMVLWMLSEANKSYSKLYQQFAAPWLNNWEHEIDMFINEFEDRGWSILFQSVIKFIVHISSIIHVQGAKFLSATSAPNYVPRYKYCKQKQFSTNPDEIVRNIK